MLVRFHKTTFYYNLKQITIHLGQVRLDIVHDCSQRTVNVNDFQIDMASTDGVMGKLTKITIDKKPFKKRKVFLDI